MRATMAFSVRLAGAEDRSRILDFEDVRKLTGVPLIDARAGERYRGEKEPIDSKAGHIPGAFSAPWTENLGPDGRFKSAEQLRERFAELGADLEEGAVVYCGSGVTAAHQVAALEAAAVTDSRLGFTKLPAEFWTWP